MYSVPIVCSVASNAVLCMLTCRWKVTIIHRGGCAGGQWTDRLSKLSLSALHLPNFDLSKLRAKRQKKTFQFLFSVARGPLGSEVSNPLQGRVTSPLMSDGTWLQRAWVGEERREGKLGRSN